MKRIIYILLLSLGWITGMSQSVELMRIYTDKDCYLAGEAPNGKILLIWTAISVLLCIFGVRKVYKEENSYVKSI